MAAKTETSLTYDKARDWVLESLGFGGACPVTPEVIEVLLKNCLGQIYSQVWNHKRYQCVWNFTVPAGKCAPHSTPEDGDPVELTTNDIFDPQYRVLHKIQRDRDCKELYEADCPITKCDVEEEHVPDEATMYPTKEVLVTKWQDRGKIKEVTETSVLDGYEAIQKRNGTRCEWSCWGDEFLVAPTSTEDETYTVYGYRKLDSTLYVFDEEDPNKIIWQSVDLPEEFHTAFQKCVLGFMYLQCGDQANATMWLRISSDEIQAIIDLNEGEAMDRTPDNSDDGPCYMNGGNRPEPFCPPPRFHFEELDGDLPRGIF